MTDSPTDRNCARSRYHDVACIGVILLLAFLLRAWDLHGTGFTSDEVSEINSAHAPLWDIVRDEDDDRFPPLYRTVLASVVKATGSDYSVRWVSVVCGVLAVYVCWRAGCDLGGKCVGLWSALILAACPFHIHFSREGRAYAFFFLATSLAIWAAIRLHRAPTLRNWVWLGAASVMAVYSHYFAIPLLAALWLTSLATIRHQSNIKQALLVMLVSVAMTVPAGFLYLDAVKTLPAGKLVAWFDLEAWVYTFMIQVSGFTLGPSMRELRTLSSREGILEFLPWVTLAGGACVVLSYHAWARLRETNMFSLMLVLLVLMVPLVGYVGNLAGVGSNYRYVVWITLPFALCLGAGAATIPKRKSALLATALLLVLNGISLWNRHYEARYAGEDFRNIATFLENHSEGQLPVLVASPYMATALDYYLDDRWEISYFPIFPEMSEQRRDALNDFGDRYAKGSRYWYLSEWLPAEDKRKSIQEEVEAARQLKFVKVLSLMEISLGEL